MAQTPWVTSSLSPVAEKERQLVWLLPRQLAEAQAIPGGEEREIALLYGGHDRNDRAVLAQLDPGAAARHSPRSSRWIRQKAPGLMRWLNRGGGRRSAPPVTSQAHPAGR